MNQQPTLTIAKIRKLFAQHRGAATQLAAEIGVHKVSVSDALRGRLKSERILAAIRKRADELSREDAA